MLQGDTTVVRGATSAYDAATGDGGGLGPSAVASSQTSPFTIAKRTFKNNERISGVVRAPSALATSSPSLVTDASKADGGGAAARRRSISTANASDSHFAAHFVMS